MQDKLARIEGAATNRRLHLIVNPTEKCNLRCVYCYEDYALGRMPRGIAEGIVRLIERRVARGLDQLELSFFGGEPMAAWPVVDRLVGEADRLCGSNVSFFGGVITNGTLLTEDRFRALAERRVVEYQITVDGPRHIHDRRRTSPRGAGSWDRVMAALRMIQASAFPVSVMIRLHYCAATVDEVRDSGIVTWLAREFVKDDPRFKILIHSLGRYGGANDAAVAVFPSDEARLAAAEAICAEAFAEGYDREQILVDFHPPICYASKANSFVVRPDGRLSKCTLDFDNPLNCVGRIDGEGRRQIDNAAFLRWVEGLTTGDDDMLECPKKILIPNR